MNRGIQYTSLILLMGVIFLGTPATAELIWEQTIHQAYAKEGEKEAKATYRFENKSDYPIVLKRIQTSCGCTTAELEKKKYLPGERGELIVTFTFGKRRGLQEKSISVETDDATHPLTVLLLRVELPDVIQIKKKELSWEVGDPLDEQAFEILLKNPKEAKIKGAHASEGFEVRLRDNQVGQSYQIIVKPLSTAAPSKGMISLETIDANGSVRYVELDVMVQE